MQGEATSSSNTVRRGLTAALLVLAAIGLGFVLDRVAPPPGWSQPELVGPPPSEQFTAQAAGFLEDFDVVVRLPLLEQLDVLRALAEQPGLLERGGESAADDGASVEDPPAPPSSAQAPSAPTTDEPPRPTAWQPQDVVAFWRSLSPAEREALGVTVEPREGLFLPEGLWPFEEAWDRYRRRPIEERLNLQFRLQKLYWFEPAQRSRLIANYRLLQAMPAEKRALLIERLFDFWELDDVGRASVTSIFKRIRKLSPEEQAGLRDLLR